MRRLITAAAAAAALAVPAVATAADNYSPPSQIPAAAQCGTGAGSGAFGAFGPGQNFGNSTSGHISEPGNPNTPNGEGADGPQTGLNNSGVCGGA